MFSEQGIPIKALIARKGPDSSVTWVEPKRWPDSRRQKMNLTELAVKTVYWFFLYGFIGWGVRSSTPPSRPMHSSTAAFSAGRSARSTASAWWGWSTVST